MSLTSLSFKELRETLDSKKASSREICQDYLDRAKKQNSQLNSFISFVDEEKIYQEAEIADQKIAEGQANPLTGIPVAVKDLICTKGHKTTAASKMLSEFVPPYDATVVQKIRQAQAPIIGKTNLDEFAMGSSNENSAFGNCRNPWNTKKVPGGSSGGSAACVASEAAPLALGTDTGGSIRQPASLCGITGLKPTYGRVSRFGVVAFASSLDQVGPMAKDAWGAAAMLECISGQDSNDATSAQQEIPSYFENCDQFAQRKNLNGFKIGIPKEYLEQKMDEEVKKVFESKLEFFKTQGAEIKEISLPHTQYALATYYLICTSEASSNLARYDGVHYGHRSEKKAVGLEDFYSQNRSEAFGDEVKLRIFLGTFALSSGYYDAYYKKAAQARRLIAQDFSNAFQDVDILLSPCSPSTAFGFDEKTADPLLMYSSDVFTLGCNLAGIPGISFNGGYNRDGLPIGIQVLAPRWKDELCLGIAAYFQSRFPEYQKGALQ